MHAAIVAILNSAPASIASPWSDIVYASPTTNGTNEDRAISWGGGSRTITNNWAAGGTLQYRLDSGSWTTYTQGGAGFSMTSGQTLAWKYLDASNINTNATVYVNGVALDTFAITVTGYA